MTTTPVRAKLFKDYTPEEKAEYEAQKKREAEEAAIRREEERLAAVPKTIETLRKEARERLDEANRIETLAKLYPGLKKFTGRWNKVAYYSACVNSEAVEVDMRHNCGCCDDSPLEVWPYVQTEHGRVYSDPPQFFVGKKHWISGDEPNYGWKDELRKVGLPENLIAKVSAHFRECAERRRELADDYYDDDD